MGRPPRSRLVDMPMRTVYFKPCGRLSEKAESVRLKFEELEALRLSDLEGLSQSEASAGWASRAIRSVACSPAQDARWP